MIVVELVLAAAADCPFIDSIGKPEGILGTIAGDDTYLYLSIEHPRYRRYLRNHQIFIQFTQNENRSAC